MPAFLAAFEVDWGWPGLSEPERTIVRRHEAWLQADPGVQTLGSLAERLQQASSALPGRQIRARARDASGRHALYASAGQCTNTPEGAFDATGKCPVAPTIDDYREAGVQQLCVAFYLKRNTVHALQTEAARLDVSLSWIAQAGLKLAPTATPAGGAVLPIDGERAKLSLYLPLELWAELSQTAEAKDCSMSTILQRALAAAWPAITAMPHR
jgi:hypothetical protein